MEKSGADIKVQKSEEMAAGSKERLIRIIGTKDQQDEAVRLILNEVSWAKGGEGGLTLLKGVEAEAKPANLDAADAKASEGEKEKEEKEKEKEEPKEEKEKVVPAVKVKPRRFRETARELNRPKSGPARWVCATCGGDHRTKECPHATGILGVGVQLGMQMGLQARDPANTEREEKEKRSFFSRFFLGGSELTRRGHGAPDRAIISRPRDGPRLRDAAPNAASARDASHGHDGTHGPGAEHRGEARLFLTFFSAQLTHQLFSQGQG
ncbi:Fs(2)Ket [Symbiodinium sp. KB8]|nr:Fs(2)Ket [Symbiodinium sp. KB8]